MSNENTPNGNTPNANESIGFDTIPVETALQMIYNDFAEICVPGRDALRYGTVLQLFAQTIDRVRVEKTKTEEKAPAKEDKPTT